MGLFLAFGEQFPDGIGSGVAVPTVWWLLLDLFILDQFELVV